MRQAVELQAKTRSAFHATGELAIDDLVLSFLNLQRLLERDVEPEQVQVQERLLDVASKTACSAGRWRCRTCSEHVAVAAQQGVSLPRLAHAGARSWAWR